MLGRAALKRTILASGLAPPSRNSSVLPSTSTGTYEHMSRTLQRLLEDDLSDSSVEIIEEPNPRMATSKHNAQQQTIQGARTDKKVLKPSLEMNSSSKVAGSGLGTNGSRVKPSAFKRSLSSPDSFFEDNDHEPAQTSVTKRRSPKQPLRTRARSFKSPSSTSRTVSMGTLPSSAVTSSIASSFSATAPSSSTSHPQLSVPPPAIKRKTSASDSLPGQRRRVDEPVDATISTVPKQPSSAETTTPAPLVDEDLPVYSFTDYKDPDPAVVYIRDEKEADRLVQTLEGPLGFDMEWRVFWNPYSQGRTALVQLCDKRTILLIQVSAMPQFPRKVVEVIENPSIVKTGANIMNDGEKLFRDFGIRAHGLVELGMFAKVADDEFMKTYSRRIVALAKMVAMYLRKTLAKGAERTSNWELVLDSKKIEYAANDVHSGCLVYHRLLDIAAEANKEIDMSAVKLDVRSSAEARFVPANTTSTSTASSVAVDSAASQVSTTSASRTAKGSYNTPLPGDPPRPQWMRAYNMWHHRDVPLSEMCSSLMCGGRVEPLKSGTVIGYIVKALQADPSLPYDIGRLTELVKMDADSWKRCGPWILTQEAR